MQTLSHTFVILQFIGFWRPVHWLPGWKTNLYNSYTWLMVFLIATLTISESIELVNSFGDLAALINNSFTFLSLIADCGKGVNILKKRSEIIELTSILQRDPCRPRSEEEITIQRKFDRLVRSNTLSYAGLVGITAAALLVRSLVKDIPRRALPYSSWLPFECHESVLGYSVAYSHQMISFTVGGVVTSCFDTLVTGLMLQTCAQLSILKYRFQDIPQIVLGKSPKLHSGNFMNLLNSNLENKLLGQCVRHHIQIFNICICFIFVEGALPARVKIYIIFYSVTAKNRRFAQTSNDLFSIMIFIQYTISIMVLCMSVYELSRMKLFGPEFVALFIYIICIVVQIFIYCFYGCEVTLESLAVGDAIYDTNWERLSLSGRRSLLTIMTRTLRPIQFTSGHVIILNLENFNNLINVSYSAYNVLQTSSK